MPSWIPVDDVVAIVNDSINDKWHWYENFDCKYIELRIDMRDGHCVIANRYGKSITLDDLKYQIGTKSKPSTDPPTPATD